MKPNTAIQTCARTACCDQSGTLAPFAPRKSSGCSARGAASPPQTRKYASASKRSYSLAAMITPNEPIQTAEYLSTHTSYSYFSVLRVGSQRAALPDGRCSATSATSAATMPVSV
jgi:hypothetical protein